MTTLTNAQKAYHYANQIFSMNVKRVGNKIYIRVWSESYTKTSTEIEVSKSQINEWANLYDETFDDFHKDYHIMFFEKTSRNGQPRKGNTIAYETSI